jgi:ribosomal protein S27E
MKIATASVITCPKCKANQTIYADGAAETVSPE